MEAKTLKEEWINIKHDFKSYVRKLKVKYIPRPVAVYEFIELERLRK